jgi:hypothetical protein
MVKGQHPHDIPDVNKLPSSLSELTAKDGLQQIEIDALISASGRQAQDITQLRTDLTEHKHEGGTDPIPPPDPTPTPPEVGELMMSTSATRSNPKSLADVPQVSGTIYVWYEPIEPLVNCDFHVNEVFERRENLIPFDLGGTGSNLVPGPYDTTTHPDGPLTITATGNQEDGGVEELAVTVEVFNETTPVPPPDGGLNIPLGVTGNWFNQFPGPDRIFNAVHTYNTIGGVQLRETDTLRGDVTVGPTDEFVTSEDGTEIHKWEKKGGRSAFLRPAGFDGPAFLPASGVKEFSGVEVAGFYPGDKFGNPASQKGMVESMPGVDMHDVIFRDSAEGFGLRIGAGMTLRNFLATDNHSVGIGGVLGFGEPTTTISGGARLRNGKHGGAGWEAGNKVVLGKLHIEHVYDEGNAMAGHWNDIDVDEVTMQYMWGVGNGNNHIKHEASGRVLITQNVSQFNGQPSVPGNVPQSWGWPAQIQIQNSGHYNEGPKPIVVTKNICDFGYVNEPWWNDWANKWEQGVHQVGIAIINQSRQEFDFKPVAGNITATENLLRRHSGNGRFIGMYSDYPDAGNIVMTPNTKVSV